MKLVVARHLLGRRAAAVFEYDEVADERQETPALADARQQNAQLRRLARRGAFAVYRSPRLEPLPAGGERPNARLDPVRDDKRLVGGEQIGDVRLVRLKLPPRAENVRAGVGGDGAFQLGDRQRQAVHEQNEVGSARVAVLEEGELVDGEPVVGVRIVEIDRPRRRAANAAAGVPILHADALDEHIVKSAVARLDRRAFGTGEPSERVPPRVRRQIGVEPRERVPKRPFMRGVFIARAKRVRPARRDIRPARRPPAELAQIFERGLLDVVFGEGGGHGESSDPAFAMSWNSASCERSSTASKTSSMFAMFSA